jgi:hypothetical protein
MDDIIFTTSLANLGKYTIFKFSMYLDGVKKKPTVLAIEKMQGFIPRRHSE